MIRSMRILWPSFVAGLLFSPDPDPGGLPDPAPTPEPKPKSATVRCEHCECQLAPDGRVMRYSDRAAELRDLEITLADTKRELAAALNKIADLERIPEPESVPAKSGGFRSW